MFTNLPIAAPRLRVICLSGMCGLLVLLLAGAGISGWLGRPRTVQAASSDLPGLAYRQDTPPPPTNCISPEQRAQIKRNIAAYEAQYGPVPATPDVVQSYPFYPQAGTLWQDLAIGNFVDLDPSSAIQIFDCSTHSYNGHTGHDVGFGYFREMAIGIPIFAALDGTVVDAHDGEFDMNTLGIGQCNPAPPANYVVLNHGGGQRTIYFHMKKNSVAVSIGQVVTAGTQLGLTGSSGCSSAPHLHFESQLNNQVYEPYAGACRAGASNWVNQIPVRQDMYARDFYFSNASPNYLNDQRLGTFVMGNGTLVWFHLEFANRPAGGTQRIRYFRPNGTTATDFTSPNLTTEFFVGSANIALFVDLDTTGTWRMLYQVNSQTIVDAPFTVVASPAQIVNRPPNPITLSFDPPAPQPGEVIFCRVNTSLYARDPDYDIMRYRYQWRVNGTLVRDATSASLSDALAKGLAPANASVTCTVTPSDGTTSAAPTVVNTTVGCPIITISPATLPDGALGTAYNQNLTQSGGNGTITWNISAGALPGGLTLNSTSGALSGTPTGTGTYNFTVRATDANNCPGERAYSLTITGSCPAISVFPATLPSGFVGITYNQTFTAQRGTSPYTFNVTAGTLPNGLTLTAATGVLAGTPTTPGTFNFTIQATDANACTGTHGYTVIISGNGLQFYALPQPVRLLETRVGFAGCTTPGAPINANGTLTLPARTTCAGIPAAAAAVTGNITVVPSGPGFLTLFPSSATQPTVANSNFQANEITNNVFTVGLGAGDGAFKIFSSATTHVIVDVTGYYAPPNTGGLYFHALATPVRLLETRGGFTGCLAPGTPLTGTGNPNADPNLDLLLQGRSPVAAPCNSIPATAQVLVGNATSVLPTGGGYLTIYPSGGTRPTVASSNYAGSDVINGPFAVKLGADGKFKIYTFATTHLVVDILGYYSEEAADANGAGLLFNPLPSPVRLLETRAGFAGCTMTGAPIVGNLNAATHTQMAANFCTLPASAQAVVGNVSVVNTTGAGFLTLFPANLTTAPLVATSNYPAPATFGYNRHYFVGLSPADGKFKVLTQFTTDLILDASGYFAP